MQNKHRIIEAAQQQQKSATMMCDSNFSLALSQHFRSQTWDSLSKTFSTFTSDKHPTIFQNLMLGRKFREVKITERSSGREGNVGKNVCTNLIFQMLSFKTHLILMIKDKRTRVHDHRLGITWSLYQRSRNNPPSIRALDEMFFKNVRKN